MALLKQGDSGPNVLELQQRLKQLGFNPGKLDGDFGPGTEAAVMAFQKSEGLLVDGAVGPRTLKQLGLAGDTQMPSIVAGVFLRADRSHKAALPNILDSLTAAELGQRSMILVALSTIRAETAGFAPIDEGLSRFNTSSGGHPFDLYDNMKQLGNQGPPGWRTFSRTWIRPVDGTRELHEVRSRARHG